MKRQSLWTLGLAAAMTTGMAMTAMAGWYQSGMDWYYYHDRTNEMLEEEWVKYNENWYYLGEDGKMATNRLIDDLYYVDANGVRVTDSWQLFVGDWDEEDSGWRYFTSNGKMYLDGMREINGQWYHFEDGIMTIGWKEIGENTYYFKESGARADGWRWLPDPDEDNWGEYWFYFGNSGKMVSGGQKKIDDKVYIFDSEGRMLYGWVDPADHTATSKEDLSEEHTGKLMFFEEDGHAADGWKYLSSPDGSNDYWYYFNDGRPYVPESDGIVEYRTTTIGEYGMTKINGEYYCFDEYGCLVTGLIYTDGKYYCFDEDDGTMVTGRATISNDEFEDQAFYFATSGGIGKRGAGLTGEKDNRVYQNGLMLKAEDGMKYEIFKITEDGDEKEFLINESGKVKTSGTVTDGDGNKFKVTKVDGEYKIERVND